MKSLIILLWLLAPDISGTRITMLAHFGDLELITENRAEIKNYQLKLDKEKIALFSKGISNLQTIIDEIHVSNLDPETTRLFDQLKGHLNYKLVEGLDQIQNYTALFFKQSIGEINSLNFDPLEIESFVPEISASSLQRLSIKLIKMRKDYANLDITAAKLYPIMEVMDNCIDTVDNFNLKMMQINSAIISIFRNIFDKSTIRVLSNLDTEFNLYKAQTIGVVGSNNALNFELAFEKIVNTDMFPKYIQVQLFNYILEQSFYGNGIDSLARPYTCNTQGCIKDMNSNCIIDLNSNNLTHFIHECDIKESYLDFEVTGLGILVYNTENSDLNELIKEHGMTITIFPSLFKFEGNYSIFSNGQLFTGEFNMKTQVIPSVYSNSEWPKILNRNFLELISSQITDVALLSTISIVVILNMAVGFIVFKCIKVICKWIKKCCCCNFTYTPLSTRPIINQSESLRMTPVKSIAPSRPAPPKPSTSKTQKPKINKD